MSFGKRILATIIASASVVSALSLSVFAYGGDHNIGYSFTVPAWQNWGYTSAEYRGTKSNEVVPWKVNFTYSAEGTNSLMQYFLLADGWDYTKLSDYKDVNEGSGPKYFHAYDTACERYVRLGARNNNNNNHAYTVSGYWDEETAQHTFSDYNY